VRDLTKWPRLIVVPDKPEPVTREQANEILLRTNGPYFAVNDGAWEKAIADVLGIEMTQRTAGDFAYWDMSWKSASEWYASIGGLDLHYLHNSRIMSAWIGGPHGWLDWDGVIGCSTWNIGKWPEYEEVSEDWSAIAAAWPFLDLHAQLITDEGDGEVAAQWRVADGTAALVEPIARFEPQELGEGAILMRILGRGGERGVSLERLREAIDQLRGDKRSEEEEA
jgi:hypothetical protein